LLRYTLAYPALLWQAGGLLLVATTAQVLGPIVIKVFIDDHVVPGHYVPREVILLATAFVGLYLVSAGASYLQAMRMNRVAFSVVRTIRSQVFASVMRKPLGWFDHRPTGKLVSRITNDTEAIKDLYVQVLATMVQNLVLIVAIFIAMAVLDLRLMIICAIILPATVLVMFSYQRLSTPRFHRVRTILSDINASLNETIQGMRIVQMLNQQQRFAARFEDTSRGYFKARMRTLKLDALLLRPMPDLLRTLVLAGTLLYFGLAALSAQDAAGVAALQGAAALDGATALKIGVMYAFINYLSRLSQPVLEMTQRLNLLQQALVAGDRVFTLLDESEQENHGSSALEGGEVAFESVGFSYDGSTPVLRDISFRVRTGDYFAIVGHTGSGKSTLMSLLLHFYEPQQGRILLGGVPLPQIAQEHLRSRVGIVLQEPFISAGTVQENITLGREIPLERVIAAAQQAQLHDFVMSLPQGYQTLLGERGGNLSTGQRQLLSLARTLAQRPAILVLDEATASIDSHTEAVIQQALKTLHGHTTIIAIAHRLSTITRADNILVLHQGEIAQQGTHAELMRLDGLYRHMYQLQQVTVEDLLDPT
jgi:ATP-binding cassette, subfamily B, multidrug efflux pump